MYSRVSYLFLLAFVWALFPACDSDDRNGTDPDTGSEIDPGDDDSDISSSERFAFSPNLQNQECPESYNLVVVPKIGGYYSTAAGINNNGWVFGASDTHMDPAENRSLGFIWKPDLDSLEDWKKTGEVTGQTEAFTVEGSHEGGALVPNYISDINESGQLVGRALYTHPSGFDGTESKGFYWSESDGLHYLEAAEIRGINDDGIVVGEAQIEVGDDRFHSPYTWTLADGFTYLPRLPGAYGNYAGKAWAINSAGVVSVNSFSAQGLSHALKYTTDTGYSKLPNYPQLGPTSIILASAGGLNDLGQMVGTSGAHPILWEANGEMHDLGILPEPWGLNSGEAVDINDDGIIIGTDYQLRGPSHSWTWCDGVKRSFADTVNDADGWHFGFVTAINNDGWITINGLDPDGAPQMAILLPYSETPPGVE